MSHDLIFLHCGAIPRCTALVDKSFDYHTLQLMTRGRVELWKGDEHWRLGPHAAWPCGPGPHIRFCPEQRGRSWSHRYAAFAGPRVNRWKQEGLLLQEPVELTPDASEELADFLDRVIRHANRGRHLDTQKAGHALEAALLRLAELIPQYGFPTEADIYEPQSKWLQAVIARLDDLDQPDPDYEALAKRFSMAASTLRRRFRAAMGQPIHRYRLSRKMMRARELLSETDLPLIQVADALGYRDGYYFCRQFTAECGVSPGRFRRSRQDRPSETDI